MKKLFLFLGFTVFTLNVLAQNNLGDTYFSQKEYSKALEAYLPQAIDGDAYAQNKVGECYRNQREFAKAFEYFKMSADQNFALGQRNLGYCYDYSQGTEHDEDKAFVYYKKAYDQNCLEAFADLAFMYLHGEGVSEDDERGIAILKEGIERQDPRCMWGMGSSYNSGDGRPQNKVMALNWYQKAADLGLDRAQNMVGIYYWNGLGGLSKNSATALKWFVLSANQGNDMGQYFAGVCYYEKGQYADAYNMFLKSAEQDNSDAQYEVAKCYRDGKGVVKDVKQTMYWLKRAADNGHEEAQEVYKVHMEVLNTKNRAEEGYTSDQVKLAEYYLEGSLLPKDIKKAYELIKMAADAGDSHACYLMACMYTNANKMKVFGLPKNFRIANDWFLKGINGSGEDAFQYSNKCREMYNYIKKTYSDNNGNIVTPTEKKYDER